jgi:regulator of sirC expression with transglutaminase-like and TPR domain
MRRRRGIPLTLAIVFMEIGWRAGMPLQGVGFPGHFLMRLSGEPGDLLLDPFRGARSVHEDDCRRMLLESTGGRVPFEPGHTASVGKRAMVLRLLHNLKGAWLRAGDDVQALSAVDRLLVLRPGDPDELRDRGLLLYRLHRYGLALEVLGAYLSATPDSPGHAAIEGHVARLMKLAADMN